MQSPAAHHVRIGSMGELWRCQAADGTLYARGQRVVCRTARGLELGTVTAPARWPVPEETEESGIGRMASDGKILRRTTAEDELLEARLLRHKRRAVERCRQEILRLGFDATLIDVDHLFDGRTLIFFFLGSITDELQLLTDSLAGLYERSVRTKHFAKLLAEGCGPGCGTQAKGGCGTAGGCSVCVAASICAN